MDKRKRRGEGSKDNQSRRVISEVMLFDSVHYMREGKGGKGVVPMLMSWKIRAGVKAGERASMVPEDKSMR